MNNENKDTVSTKIIVANNLKKFIKHTGRSPAWFTKKTGISKITYHQILNGEGDIDQYAQRIINLFGIKDPFYFHKNDFKLPSFQKRDTNLTELLKTNWELVKGEEREFENTLIMLNDFINVIEILKKNNL